MNESGWFIDPFGVHEQRWLSQGVPTSLVRDGHAESRDEPPPGPMPRPLHEPGWVQVADGSDLYRAGSVPWAPTGIASSRITGKAVLGSSWSLLLANPRMLVLAAVGGLISLGSGAVLFLPLWDAMGGQGNVTATKLYVALAIAGLGSAIVSIFFQAALSMAANAEADGRSPKISTVLFATARMSGRIVAWALLGTLVGTVIRFVERRLGAFGFLVGLLAGLSWAVATFFVIPVLVIEGHGPITTLRHSAQVVKERWGLGLRTSLRFGFISLVTVVPGVMVLVGIMFILTGPEVRATGWLLLVVGAVLLYAISGVLTAVMTYAKTMIYRLAVGLAAPGIPADAFASVFSPVRRRR